MTTKYNFDIPVESFKVDINRLTNQIWKLIPMRENNEDWLYQLNSVIIEIVGLKELFSLDSQFLILLSKLEGLKSIDSEFNLYRKTVFESITLLRGLKPWLTV